MLAIGTRLQDFTTGSHALFPQATLVSLNVNGFDALKWHGAMLRADARRGLEALSAALGGWRSDDGWRDVRPTRPRAGAPTSRASPACATSRCPATAR